MTRKKTGYTAMKGTCPDCGQPMHYSAKTCRQCMGARMSRIYVGRNSRGWSGGRHIQKGKDYVRIYMPEHPRAKSSPYIYEHIYVWEQTHNKLLPEGWHVHHLNGIRSDNRPINLVALSSHKHSLVLEEKAKRIQKLEALLNNQGHLL